MEDRIKELARQGGTLFSDRQSFMSLLQEIAENFYPQRSTFTACKWVGQDFAANLTTSFPLSANRDLQEIFLTMLQPPGELWFEGSTNREDKLRIEDRRWLDMATKTMRNAMYDRKARYSRAIKETLGDIVPFGQGVMSAEVNRMTDTLLYRNWHLRDVAWVEGVDGSIGRRERKWKTSVHTINQYFKGNIPQQMKTALVANPRQEFEIRHCVIPAEDWEAPAGKQWRKPWVSIWYSMDCNHVFEEVAIATGFYIIPRWQTVSDSQYSYSPATVAALPDARLIQDMVLTLLEAGQKAVDPPMIAVQEAIKNVDVFAGGTSFVAADYDERLGEVLRPINQDFGGITYGFELLRDIQTAISNAFYLNKINLPASSGGKMTAYETSVRVQEYVRNALPLFDPLEDEVNGQVCDDTFALLMDNRAFGDMRDIPQGLQGSEISFRFKNPLKDYAEKAKSQVLLEGMGLISSVAQLDPAAVKTLKTKKALPDALVGLGMPADWIASEDELADAEEAAAAQAETANMLAQLQQAGETAESFGKASQALQPEMV